MQNGRNITPLTELDLTVADIIPTGRRHTGILYILLISSTFLLSVFSVAAFYK